MKQLIYIIFVLFVSGNLLVGCNATDNDLESGWDTNRSDSSNVTVDTLQGIDASMYEKARVFPGLVDTAKEAHVKDTLISVDLSKTYKSMADLNLSYKYASGSSSSDRSMPQPIYSTGLYAGAGELITITVPDDVWGLMAQIGVQTEDLTKNNAGLREPLVYVQKALYPGKNTVRSPLGGYLWILRDPNKTGDVTQLKIENAYAAPDFILGQTDPQTWAQRIRTTTVPWLDLRGKHFVFSVDRQHMEQYILNDAQFPQKMETALFLWDKLITYYYDSFGFNENSSDPFYAMPSFKDRFVFDVQLTDNKLTQVNNTQAVMMVQTNRLYDNLVNLDSIRSLNVMPVYQCLLAKYSPLYRPFNLFSTVASYIPLYRLAEDNMKNGLTQNIGDIHIELTELMPSSLTYASADSAKSMSHEKFNTNAALMTALLQLTAYASHYQHEDEWAFYRQLWSDSRKDKIGLLFDNYFIQKLCAHYNRDFTPFFDHWGISISDAARAKAAQYPLLDKTIWDIDPLAADPFVKVKDYRPSRYLYRVDRSNWQIGAFDKNGNINEDEKNKNDIQNLIDGDKSSLWRNYLNGDDSPYEQPYYIVIDMGNNVDIDGFYFANGYISNWAMPTGFTVQTTGSSGFNLSEHDQQTWTTLGTVGTASAPQNGQFNEQFFKFQNGSHNVRYLRLVFDKPNMATPERLDKTQADFDKYHWGRRQMMAEFGVYYYNK